MDKAWLYPAKEPIPVKLMVAAVFRDEGLLNEAIARLAADYGEIDQSSAAFAFDHTKYYETEMGTNLRKQFFAFVTLRAPDALVDLKYKSLDVEWQFSRAQKRQINLDPAYMELAKIVVSSRKNFSHRIYIGRNVYGDVQLQFRGGKFVAQAWTYPDYVMPEVLDFFENVRERYQEQLKSAA